jgi:hypothetical protein
LKSKAPASGVPARLRVFCLTPCSIPLPNSASSSAPAPPQGLRGGVRPVGLNVLDLRKRWHSSPDPKSGGYARASTLGQGPAPFPPDAGAQRTADHDERSIEAREQALCRSTIFPCQKIDDRGCAKFGAPVGPNFSCAAARRDIHTTPVLHQQPSRTLEAGAVDGSIELPWSASPRQRHSQVATSATVCNRRLRRTVTAHDGTT